MSEPAGQTHAMRAMIELRRRILSGELPGGTRLLEIPLAEALEISRTPVREAMSRLAEEGLLDRVKSGGFLVRTFLYQDVIDAIELRGVLEGTAARFAAERGADPAGLERLRAIVAELDACFGDQRGEIDFAGYFEANARFHRELAGLARSSVIARELDRVARLPFASPSSVLPDRVYIAPRQGSLDVAQAQHRAIVDAITNRESTRAEHLAREHARTARRDIEYVMRVHHGLIGEVSGLAVLI